MPFGLMNMVQTFQRLMDRLFCNFPFVFTYLDDHLIASRTLEEHMEHLSQFFRVLQDTGLTINPGKCTFTAPTVKFLGHMVSETGIMSVPCFRKARQRATHAIPPTSLQVATTHFPRGGRQSAVRGCDFYSRNSLAGGEGGGRGDLRNNAIR
jgi:hypothetical protein